MSTINYTYNVIVDRFRQFAAGHFQLRRFTHGEISQADLEKEAEWPWLHVKPRAINYAPGTRSFSFEIFISDLPRDKEDKTGYQAESITDCSLIFQDLINEIYLGNMFGSNVELTRPVNSEPFVEQYTHTLTGVTGTIELNLDYDWSACSIPASWNYNTPTDSPSDGWGALQFIESLDQNGVFVSLLNDVEAPGNSYYYGTNASGVKGWYAIVDNVGLTCETLPDCATIISIVDDIAALQTDVALKANTADLGATAFSNDYNDLDNLPTIPAQYNPTAGTGVSITGTYPNQTITNTAPDQTVALTAGTNIGVTGTYPNFTISNTQSLAGYVPTTRSITINGTTQDLSADRTFTIATGLTVGTTPITSGTVGRVLFEGTGNVLQESANLFWDDTNNRLGIGTNAPTVPLEVNGSSRLGFTRSTDIFVIGGTATTNTANARFWSSGGQAPTSGLYRGFYTDISFIPSSGSAEWYGLDLRPTINQTGTATGVTRGLYIAPTLTSAANFRAIETTAGNVLFGASGTGFFWDNTNGKLGIGTASPIYRLSVIDTQATYVASFRGSANSYIQVGANTLVGEQGVNMINSSCQAFLGVIGTEAYFVGTSGATIMRFSIGGSERMRITGSTGNVGIGTTTDAGFKLDVNGTARVSGAMTFANSSSINASGNLAIGAFSIHSSFGFSTFSATTLLMTGGTFTSTSGTQIGLSFTGAFNPTSGTATYAGFSILPTINQTGGANGITRGLYINPTLTAAADFRAIEVANGTTVLAPSVTARASLRIPSGTAPTSPVNGDIWFDGTDIKMRIGGVTKTFTLI